MLAVYITVVNSIPLPPITVKLMDSYSLFEPRFKPDSYRAECSPQIPGYVIGNIFRQVRFLPPGQKNKINLTTKKL